jgi:hypothetical protein
MKFLDQGWLYHAERSEESLFRRVRFFAALSMTTIAGLDH